MNSTLAEQIIQVYGNIMELQSPSQGCVADTSELPFPKEQIKNAIIFGLESTDNPQIKEALKTGYIQLAAWQDGVGNSHIGINYEKMDLDENPRKLVNQISNQRGEIEKWMRVAEMERQSLKNELIKLGLW